MFRQLIRTGKHLLVFALSLAALIAISGYSIFSRASEDSVERVDAIVVLGGEHDGRELYGLSLARQGIAPAVLMSDPYGPADPIMKSFCDTHITGVEVICRQPHPSTTRGEALLARQFAMSRNWNRIMVVTWRFHLPRARLIFSQCYSDSNHSVIYRAVPRSYEYSPLRWVFTYAYQYGAFAKAVLQGRCDSETGSQSRSQSG